VRTITVIAAGLGLTLLGVGVAWAHLHATPERPRVAYGGPVPGRTRADPAHPDIIVITLCSVRADHTDLGGAAGVTPTIRSLGNSGTSFALAWSNATFTLPAHAAILMGLVPARAGVMEATDHLDEAHPTLPEDRKSTRLNSSHNPASRMPSSA
jgi:hypothetical protein